MTKPLTTIGPIEAVEFPQFNLTAVPARIDTGARTSTVWASRVREVEGALHFTLFDAESGFYSGREVTATYFGRRSVTSSNGITEERYIVKLVVVVGGRKIQASFTLANRATQTYPVLIGRNILRGKFLVDVKQNQLLQRPNSNASLPTEVRPGNERRRV